MLKIILYFPSWSEELSRSYHRRRKYCLIIKHLTAFAYWIQEGKFMGRAECITYMEFISGLIPSQLWEQIDV